MAIIDSCWLSCCCLTRWPDLFNQLRVIIIPLAGLKRNFFSFLFLSLPFSLFGGFSVGWSCVRVICWFWLLASALIWRLILFPIFSCYSKSSFVSSCLDVVFSWSSSPDVFLHAKARKRRKLGGGWWLLKWDRRNRPFVSLRACQNNGRHLAKGPLRETRQLTADSAIRQSDQTRTTTNQETKYNLGITWTAITHWLNGAHPLKRTRCLSFCRMRFSFFDNTNQQSLNRLGLKRISMFF